MKTEIHITGEPIGNNWLYLNLTTEGCEIRRTPFNGYVVTYPTKKAAKSALWSAYRSLIKKEPEYRHGIRYSAGYGLTYDASRATIHEAD